MLSPLKPVLLLALGLLIATEYHCFSSCGTGKICRAREETSSHTRVIKYPKLLVFVSFAMPMTTLKEFGSQVTALGGALVFRGLVAGSFRKTAEKLKELKTEAMIDPTLFEAYEIEAVPTFILRKSATDTAEKAVLFDRISGNVSLRHVLEEFAHKGDVQEIARTHFQELQGHS